MENMFSKKVAAEKAKAAARSEVGKPTANMFSKSATAAAVQGQTVEDFAKNQILHGNWEPQTIHSAKDYLLSQTFNCKNYESAKKLGEAFGAIKGRLEQVATLDPRLEDETHRGFLISLSADNSVEVSFSNQTEFNIAQSWLKLKGSELPQNRAADLLVKVIADAYTPARPR